MAAGRKRLPWAGFQERLPSGSAPLSSPSPEPRGPAAASGRLPSGLQASGLRFQETKEGSGPANPKELRPRTRRAARLEPRPGVFRAGVSTVLGRGEDSLPNRSEDPPQQHPHKRICTHTEWYPFWLKCGEGESWDASILPDGLGPASSHPGRGPRAQHRGFQALRPQG